MVSKIIDIAPARRVIEDALALNEQLGHENLGSLSYTHGFLPRTELVRAFPSEFRAWDQATELVPQMFRTYTGREVLDEMPLLDADNLPDYYLVRGNITFSILNHFYWYCEPDPPENGIPIQLQQPWEKISARLNRPAPHLSFIDMNSHNWYFLDPTLPQPFLIENLKLAIPLIGNEYERRFQMSPVEISYLLAPMMEAMINAQEAVIHDDPALLEKSFRTLTDTINIVTYQSLSKVNPNPYHFLYANPVVWGKTAALFASPFQKENIPGPSGTAIPSFTSFDIFFGRKTYKTGVGRETDRYRSWYPKHWQDWLNSLEMVSIPDYLTKKNNRALTEMYEEARDAYAGESGFLNRHRMKAYGFLDLSFKAGRVKTLGGASGSYSARVWDRMATELDDARLERYGVTPQTAHMVPIKGVELVGGEEKTAVRRIVFDISGTGIRYQSGDRCGILPENSEELINKTLRALHARGDEIVQLNANWRLHVNMRSGYEGVTELPLHTLLKFGHIRPVDRVIARALYNLTGNQRLSDIMDAWAEDQWELWDLLALLEESGFNPKRLWKAVLGDYDHICRIVPPERWRLYSISSMLDATPGELHLSIGTLAYHTHGGDVSHDAERWGTGSRFLTTLSPERSTPVSIKVVHPPRFSLPADPTRPVIMFAGGTGIAPMRGLIEDRMRDTSPDAGAAWLFFGTRSYDDFYYHKEFAAHVQQGRLNVRTAFSREDISAEFDRTTGQFKAVEGERGHIDSIMLEDDNARLLWDMLRPIKDGGQGAYIYLCGRTAFANTVLDSIKQIIARHIEGETPEERATLASQMLYRLVGEDRFLLEIFTTYDGAHNDEGKPQFTISDVVMHNDDQAGYWIIISGRVYDVNEFNHMHPGGAKIIQSYSGMDATFAYQKVEHHINPEVDSMLGMYALGILKTPNFGQVWGVALSGKGMRTITLRDTYLAWVDFLHMIVEIENAITNDYRILDEPYTDIETDENTFLTPVKVAQVGLTHERLITGYLDYALNEPLNTLWAVTIGLANRIDLDVRWTQQQFQEINATEMTQSAIKFGYTLRQMIKQDRLRDQESPEVIAEKYGAICERIEQENRRVVRELKLTLREGVMTFEKYEQQTIQRGGDHLISTLQRIPEIVRGFYQHIYDVATGKSQHKTNQ
jgi:sulfite reductase (NADPH) flavoprotein alpha-component